MTSVLLKRGSFNIFKREHVSLYNASLEDVLKDWKELPSESRIFYNEFYRLSLKEKESNERYKQRLKDAAKLEPRQLSSYNIFFKENYSKYAKKQKSTLNMILLAKIWRTLSDDDKLRYKHVNKD